MWMLMSCFVALFVTTYKTHFQSVTQLFLLALDKQDLPWVAVHRWLLQMFSVEANFTTNSQDSHNNVHSTSVSTCVLLWTRTRVFRHWSERRVKAELSFALLNPCPSSASYSQGDTVKDLYNSLPLALISLVVPTEPCQVGTLRYIKSTQIL